MSLQPLIQQLCRILGRDTVSAALHDDPSTVSAPTVAQVAAFETLVSGRRGDFVGALIAEAGENDDVATAEAALGYARLRLDDFAPVLSDRLRAELELAFQELTAGWG